MIIVELKGGLGNQMFQYAAGKALAIELGLELRLSHAFFETELENVAVTPRRYELSAFDIDLKATELDLIKVRLSEKISRFFKAKNFYLKINEINEYKANTVFPAGYNNIYLTGYYQSDFYFNKIQEIIKKDFTFIPPYRENVELINRVTSTKNSVGILVRRDDFITAERDQSLPIAYFEKAINEIKSRIQNPFFYVFTIGEVAWSRSILKFSKNMEVIQNVGPNMKGFEKMRLMALCNHNIIPNSSYGWWSAWLNSNPEKIIIAPKNWHYDSEINKVIINERLPKAWHLL
jgi:hypothetical protein